MPRYCAAVGCQNDGMKQACRDKKISFHCFPLNNPHVLKQWLINVKRARFQPTEYSVLCSEHFKEECFVYQNFTNARRLKPEAVPTLFAFSNPASASNQKRRGPIEMVKACSVVGCNMRPNTNLLSQVRTFSFPADPVRSLRWEFALRRKDWKPTKCSRVCNRHFVEGKPSKDSQHVDYVPTLNLGYTKTLTPLEKYKEAYCRKKKKNNFSVKKNEDFHFIENSEWLIIKEYADASTQTDICCKDIENMETKLKKCKSMDETSDSSTQSELSWKDLEEMEKLIKFYKSHAKS